MGNILTNVCRTIRCLGGTQAETDQRVGSLSSLSYSETPSEHCVRSFSHQLEPQDNATNHDPTAGPDSTDSADWDLEKMEQEEKLKDEAVLRVHREHLEKEALKHETCGDDCGTRRMLEQIAAMVSVDTESSVNQGIVSKATQIVQWIIDNLPQENPAWIFSKEQRGSTTNGSKTGRLDEVDFLLKLENVELRAEDGWRLVRDSNDLGISRTNLIHKESNYQVFGTGTVLNNFIRETSLGNDYLSAEILKMTFEKAVTDTLKRMGKTPQHMEKSSTNTLRYGIDTGYIMLFPCDVSHAVKVDITPCICFTDRDDKRHWLVPRGYFNNWQAVNEDPDELSCPVVNQAMRVIKTIRDLSELYINEKFYSRDVFCMIAEGSGGSQYKSSVSDHLTSYAAEAQTPKLFTQIPSYAILGTVVQCYRASTKKAICSLVLQSIRLFETIDVHGNFLCAPAYGTHSPLQIHTALITSCCALLQHFPKNEAGLTVESQDSFPPKYLSNPRSIQHFLQTVHPPLYSVPGVVKINDSNWDNNSASSPSSWEVYRVDKEELTAWLLHLIKPSPWSVNDYRRSDRIDQLRQELKEVRSDDTAQLIYLAVLRLKDSYLSDSPYGPTIPRFRALPGGEVTVEDLLKALSEEVIAYVQPVWHARV